jgi:hypothetical protein
VLLPGQSEIPGESVSRWLLDAQSSYGPPEKHWVALDKNGESSHWRLSAFEDCFRNFPQQTSPQPRHAFLGRLPLVFVSTSGPLMAHLPADTMIPMDGGED